MDISEIKVALSAYDPKHLQIFSHLLQYFEGENVHPSVIRQVIGSVISEDAKLGRILKIRSRVKPEKSVSSIELKACPSCGKLTIGDPIKVDGCLISACELCRWSDAVVGR